MGLSEGSGLTIRMALQQASLLHEVSDTAHLDVTVMLSHVLAKDRAYLYTWPDQMLSEAQHTQFSELVARRRTGEPIAHLVGQREFWSLPLRVSANTLIPRPETELLVAHMLEFFPLDKAVSMLDLGTGTGAIALAFAAERPDWQITAVDNSEASLEIARLNAQALELPQVVFVQSDWFAQIANLRFDLVVSNPPYIAEGDNHLREGDLRFEPKSALASGCDGLNDLRQIIREAPNFLVSGGWLAVEHGYQQGTAVRELFVSAGFEAIETQLDLAGLERMTYGRSIVGV